MKSLFLIVIYISCSITFGQNQNFREYSEDSKISVFYDFQNKETRPVAIYVNDKFVGEVLTMNFVPTKQIESIHVEKENYTINGIEYYGKIYIKTKAGYKPKFILLKDLKAKYLKLDSKPVIYQIDEDIVNVNDEKFIVNEKFILKIHVQKIFTKKYSEINLVKIITKTPENIKKANEIKIRGNEI
ncbi:hypothetical protein NO995_12540 [Aestuariibaculum sp. M13]|uniref:hypothetical protein n=1 Tax=Aestuariibaculum sp. M13 TaxID=2967132 RepID=UPI002159F3A5|nr:hypothetical protein [Aestuariibaculum sp. M13]MCR8668514.1 hypothetical protein [Aestuariibaculum sp. M13]